MFKMKSNSEYFYSSRMAPKCAIATLYSSKYYRGEKNKILLGKKIKSCQEQPHLLSGCFLKLFNKTTTHARRTFLNDPKSGHLIQV